MNYEKLFRQARAHAKKNGLEDEAEDFAQWVCTKQHENEVITNFKYLLCDYRDLCSADKRILSSPQGQLSGFRTISFDAPLDGEEGDSPTLGDLIGMPGLDVGSGDSDGLIEILQQNFYGRDREILNLMLDDLTMKEIGVSIGLTESRISQLVQRIANIAMVFRMVPENSRQWMGEHVFRRGKQRTDVLKKGLLEQNYRRKFIHLREDGEVSSDTDLQEARGKHTS